MDTLNELDLYEWEPVAISQDIDTNKQTYNSLISSAMNARAKAKGQLDSSVSQVTTAMITWLNTTDFYTAPASTKFHECFPGGLVIHTLKVYNEIIDLLKLSKFKSVNVASAVFVALTHDWCKINKYEAYQKNIKDESGNWIQQSAYKSSETYMGLGHGPQSLMMVTQFCNSRYTKLSFEEMAAIRWHMYTYDVTSYDIGDLNRCNDDIPLVHLLQFADQLAIVNY